MPSTTGLRFLRPYLSEYVPATRKPIYVRFFHSTRCQAIGSPKKLPQRYEPGKARSPKHSHIAAEIDKDRANIDARIKELKKDRALNYPRLKSVPNTMSVKEYQRKYGSMTAGEKRPLEMVTVYGMCGVVL
jgi:hypothetical protein